MGWDAGMATQFCDVFGVLCSRRFRQRVWDRHNTEHAILAMKDFALGPSLISNSAEPLQSELVLPKSEALVHYSKKHFTALDF